MIFEQWYRALRLRLQSLLRRRQAEKELDEEFLFHVENLTESYIGQGMSAPEARYQALKAMEGYEQKKEECRDLRGIGWIENLARDVRYGLRMLRRSPVFTTVAILSLALGIGANSAIFSLVDTLLFRPLPVPNPHELRHVFLRLPERPQPFLSYPMFQGLQAHNQAFVGLAAWANKRFQMAAGDDVIHVEGTFATGNYFSVLNVPPAQGRAFTEADDYPAGGKDGPVAVVSDRFWSSHLQRSPSAIGRGIVLNGVSLTVIGVMPPGFFGAEIGTHPDVWIPVSLATRIDDSGCLASHNCWWLTVMARSKPGITAEQANAHLGAISGDVLRETTPPAFNAAMKDRYRAYIFSSDSGEQGWSFLRLQFSDPLRILVALVTLALLTACANMANLLLARASARHREIAVRLSMGAGRARIIGQILTESVLLSLAGGVAGIFLALWLTRILTAYVAATHRHGPGQFTRLELVLDWRVMLFTFGVALLSGILFGLAPALRSTRVGILPSLKESAHNLRGSASRFQPGRLLLALQTALSVVLVAAAGLFAGSLYHLLSVDYGFNPDGVSIIAVDTDKRPEKGPALTALYGQVLARANALPGVKSASLLWHVPLTFPGWGEKVRVPGKTESQTSINWIGPRFFDTMEIGLLAGRQFNEGDSATAEKVGVINQLAAQRFFPGENAIGRHIQLGNQEVRIVGVVEGIKYTSLRANEPLELYIPYAQKAGPVPSYHFAIKTQPGAPSPNPAFRALLHELAPDVPMGMAYTMTQQVESSVGLERLMATLSLFFGTLALLLSSVGLYGTLAYTVTRRTGEIGIRLALGARRAHVIWLVLRGSLGYVLAGLGIGTITALAASRLIAALLYGVKPTDPANLAAAIIALLLVAAAASLFPSLRVSRIDPAISLRQE